VIRIAPSGKILHGRAGVPACIDNVPIVGICCGDWDWLTPSNAAGQVCSGSPEACYLRDENGAVLDHQGASFFRASQGRWLAALGSQLRSNFGVSVGDSVPIASDIETGDLVAVSSYQTGRGITVYRADGSVLTLDVPIANAPTHTSICRGLLSFVHASEGPRVYDLNTGGYVPIAAIADPPDWTIACRMPDGSIVLAERTTSGGTVRVRRSTSGSGLLIPQAAYSLAALPMGSLIKVAWSVTQGEEPGNVGEQTIDPDTLPGVAPVPPSGAVVSTVNADGSVSPAPADLATSMRSALGDVSARSILIVVGIAIAAVVLIDT
jgi:hypothetical protein